MQRLSEVGERLTADLADLQAAIPVLVRSIWGAQSEAVVGALRQRQAAARRLIAQWEEAEHRLVAVANSLATLQNGQVGACRGEARGHAWLCVCACVCVQRGMLGLWGTWARTTGWPRFEMGRV